MISNPIRSGVARPDCVHTYVCLHYLHTKVVGSVVHPYEAETSYRTRKKEEEKGIQLCDRLPHTVMSPEGSSTQQWLTQLKASNCGCRWHLIGSKQKIRSVEALLPRCNELGVNLEVTMDSIFNAYKVWFVSPFSSLSAMEKVGQLGLWSVSESQVTWQHGGSRCA